MDRPAVVGDDGCDGGVYREREGGIPVRATVVKDGDGGAG